MIGPVLLVNYVLPPVANAVALQNGRFVQSLMNSGVSTISVVKSTPDKRFNESSIVIKETPNKVARHLFTGWLNDLKYLPDIESYTWKPSVIRKLRSNIDFSRLLWIQTTSSPMASHMVGLELKYRFKRPWVAQFYDPWIDNTYRSYLTGSALYYNERLEREVAFNADVIIHTNDIIKERWVERYGNEIQDKIVVIPLLTDEKITCDEISKHREDGRINFVHAGGIYGERRIDSLVEALLLARKEGFDLEGKMKVTLMGIMQPESMRLVREAGLSEMFRVLPPQGPDDVRKVVSESDILMLIEAPDTESVFFPSKICEYFSYRKPIFGLTACDSPGKRMLGESGHLSVPVADPIAIKSAIVDLVVHRKRIVGDDLFYKRFLPETIMKAYFDFLTYKGIVYEN